MPKFILIATGVGLVIAAVLAAFAGMPVAGGAIGGAVGGVVGVMMIAGAGCKNCPRCRTELPATRKPQSLKQALWGGWTCPNCGCEVDRQGRAILTVR